MEWKDTYNIGVDEVDSQHRQLADMVTRLETSLATDQESKELGNTLKFLVDYTKKHFAAEEDLMVSSGFPGLTQHKKLHKTLIQEVTGVLIGLKKGQALEPQKLITFLTEWLVNHILEEDKQIGDFIGKSEQSKVTATPEEKKHHITDLMKKFEKLKTLFNQKLIAEQDYVENKANILNNLCESTAKNKNEKLLDQFNFLSELLVRKLITKEEGKTTKTMLLEKGSIEDLMAGIDSVEEQFQFLKKILHENIITSEQYDEQKTKLLMEI